MKVLHVMGSGGGGSALTTLALIEWLAERGVASGVVCNDDTTPSDKRRIQDALGGRAKFVPLYTWHKKLRAKPWKRPLLELRQLTRSAFSLRSVGAIAHVARRDGFELIHSSNMISPDGAKAARLLGLPHVWHLRELIGPGCPFQLPLAGERLARYLRLRAAKIIANSRATANCLPALGGLVELIPNGLRVSDFQPSAPRSGPLVVAMVGSLAARWKRHDFFLKAIAKVARRDVRFRIYGGVAPRSGDEYVRGLHEAARALGLEARLEWRGHEDPRQIMADIDILMHPATHETFGRIVVEAMSAGLPVIGMNAGGVAELVVPGGTGFLFGETDSAAVARCIDELATSPELRARLGAAGRVRAEQHYSIDASCGRILGVYKALSPGHSQP